VAYDVAGLRDSVRNGVTGFLVEAGCTESLAEGVVELLGDESLRETLSKSALEYSRQFSWDNTAGEFLRVVEEML
jgi:glycosyltransferase involved in cell wall biosynthesis